MKLTSRPRLESRLRGKGYIPMSWASSIWFSAPSQKGECRCGCRDSSDGRRSEHLLRTRHLDPVSKPPSVPSSFSSNLPIELNSNLTRPFRGPSSNTMTRPVGFSAPFAVARNAEEESSSAAPLVKTPGQTSETGM